MHFNVDIWLKGVTLHVDNAKAVVIFLRLFKLGYSVSTTA
jgi:hypothetical protein